MYETPFPLDPRPAEADRGSPRERWLAGRRRAEAGVSKLAASVASVMGPRAVELTDPSGRRGPLHGAAGVISGLGTLAPEEEVGARPLRQVARKLSTRAGDGLATGVCLAGSLILQALREIDRGACRRRLLGEVSEALTRARLRLRELSRQARAEDFAALVRATLRDPDLEASLLDLLAEVPPERVLVVPWTGDRVVTRKVTGLLVSLVPQAAFMLPPAGTVLSPAVLSGTHPHAETDREVIAGLEALGHQGRIPVAVADRLGPGDASRLVSRVLGGTLSGAVLWSRPLEPGVGEALAAFPWSERPELEVHLLGRMALLSGFPAWSTAYGVVLHAGSEVRLSRLETTCRVLCRAKAGGLVPGGTATLPRAGDTLEDGRPGHRVVRRGLEAPLRVLLDNEGLEPESVVGQLRTMPAGTGFDLVGRRFLAPEEAGPAVPVDHLDAALEVAGEAALDFLESEPWADCIRGDDHG